MAIRREINSKHEHAVLDAALRAHNERSGTNFTVESRPDPPDAILIDGNKRIWMEHTDVFYHPSWAEDLSSFAATDKVHRPMQKGLHMNMDNIVAGNFAEAVLKKLNNDSYESVIERFGAGILVVGVESPWLDQETVRAINSAWIELGSPELSAVFQCVYLGFRVNGENSAVLWECA